MITDIVQVARFGGDQAEAASRGEGKGTICECVIILLICTGVVSFPVLFGATHRDADQILTNIKAEFETNQLLHDDFPEVCHPIWELEGAPQRAGGQTVKGQRTRMQWSGDGVVFPTVKGSKASGAVLMTRGLDGAIRGVRYIDRRPTFALIDDPDTRESSQSPLQQAKRETLIEADIAGLPAPGVSIGRLILGTLIGPNCIAAKFTDPKQKPSWRGRRFKMLRQMPEREDLWAEYIRLRQDGFDPNGGTSKTAANDFYLKNRKLMDAGAEVSNPRRFNSKADPPEYSTLQFCHNWIADRGMSSFLTELQNDPPAEEGPQSSGITPGLISKRLSGYPMNCVPRGHVALTAFLDVGERKGCHFMVVAWFAGGRGVIVEYGVQDVNNLDTLGNVAITNALMAWREERLRNPYMSEDGKPVPLDMVLVDAGDGQLESTVFNFVKSAGLPYRASKGFGSTGGRSPFRAVPKRTPDRKPGHHYFESRQGAGVWLVGLDVDHWKGWVHERFQTEHRDEANNLRAGSLTIFGDDERRHHTLSRHICAEVREQAMVRGKGMIWKWVVKNRNNDWFDCAAGAAAAGCMCGVALQGESARVAQAQVIVPAGGWFANQKRRAS
jgi:hypothetical protein